MPFKFYLLGYDSILTLPTCSSTIFLDYVVSNQIKHLIHPLDSRPGGVRHTTSLLVHIGGSRGGFLFDSGPGHYAIVREPFYSPGYDSHPHYSDFVLDLFF